MQWYAAAGQHVVAVHSWFRWLERLLSPADAAPTVHGLLGQAAHCKQVPCCASQLRQLMCGMPHAARW